MTLKSVRSFSCWFGIYCPGERGRDDPAILIFSDIGMFSPSSRQVGSKEQHQINGLNARARLFNATYFAAAIIATGGWTWLLYTSLKWAIVDL